MDDRRHDLVPFFALHHRNRRDGLPLSSIRLGTERCNLGPSPVDYPAGPSRLGFEHAYNGYTLQDVGIGPAATNAAPSRYSRGFGAIAGAGADYSLTSTFALTSGLYAMRTNMVSYQTIGLSAPSESPDFRLTTYRLVLGIKYNPVRMVTALQNR